MTLCARRYRYFKVKRIHGIRVGPKEKEYLVEWKDKQPDGSDFDLTWQPAHNLTKDLVIAADNKFALQLSMVVPVDIAPLVMGARATFATVVRIAKTQCRPRIHKFTLEMFRCISFVQPFFDMCKRLAGDGAEQLNSHQFRLSTMSSVAKLLQFDYFICKEKAIGALRFEIGRASNHDMMCVGVPILFTWRADHHKTITSQGMAA